MGKLPHFLFFSFPKKKIAYKSGAEQRYGGVIVMNGCRVERGEWERKGIITMHGKNIGTGL